MRYKTIEQKKWSLREVLSLLRLQIKRLALRKNTSYQLANRLLFCKIGILFALMGITLRLLVLTLGQETEEPSLVENTTTEVQTEDGANKTAPVLNRAEITDRQGFVLATNVPIFSLYANPKDILNVDEAVKALRQIFPELDQASLATKLKADSRFVWVKRHMTPKEHQAIQYLGIPGVYATKESKRVYTYPELFSHVIGYTDLDNNGIAGIEAGLDDQLRQQKQPVQLTIDMRIQHIVRQALTDGIEKYHAIGGVGIVANVKNGDILAMVSLPDFDPHHAGQGNAEALFNRATLGVYEMGSTFKIFTTAMALETKVMSLKDGYDTRIPIRSAGFTIKDYHPQNRWLSVPEIFMHSSNIGSAHMARLVGTDGHKKFLKNMGFFEKLPLPFPEMGQPLVPKHWPEISTLTIAYGHGMSVTPLHTIAGMSGIVNNGIMPDLRIYRDPKNLRMDPTVASGRRVISEETSYDIRRLLRLVVESGTGKKAAVPGYMVGGKTGTAEKPNNGHYKKNSNMSSFIGVFPIIDPDYIVLVMLDEPQGIKETYGYSTGGWVAAPLAKEIIERAGPLLGCMPVQNEQELIEEHLQMQSLIGDGLLETY